jgi:hypothetical protein
MLQRVFVLTGFVDNKLPVFEEVPGRHSQAGNWLQQHLGLSQANDAAIAAQKEDEYSWSNQR